MTTLDQATAFLCDYYSIGTHIGKKPTLMDTINSFPDIKKPYQIFLGGPQNTRMSIKESELVATRKLIEEKNLKVYVHSQYIINLCHTPTNDDWNTKLLIKNLEYANAIGCKGVVVHVGKSTKQELSVAMESMRKNVETVIQHANVECPLLLETPAGQGTETLCDSKQFIDFVVSFNDPRIRICVDTCHVFACGYNPQTYVEEVCNHGDLLRLIHYNDSSTPCGSRVDRHAFMGHGHIGIDKMASIAKCCGDKKLSMVIE